MAPKQSKPAELNRRGNGRVESAYLPVCRGHVAHCCGTPTQSRVETAQTTPG